MYPLFQKRFFQVNERFDPLRGFSFSLELSSAGVAPLPPSYHKLLSETVTTFAVFPSWMYLLDGEDNCMLSVPFSTSDLHFSCWQSGENCQAVAAGAFMFLGYALWFSSKRGCSPYLSVLLSCSRVCLLDVSRLLGLTPRHSAPVCCHRDSLTRGRLAFAQEAVRGPPFSLFGSAPVGCARWFQAASEKCLFKRC